MAPNATSQVNHRATVSTAKTSFKLDLNKPLVFQVGHLGEDYDDWVHQPIISKTGPRLFESDLMEMFTVTKWWVIPMVWLPVIFCLEWKALSVGTPVFAIPPLMLLGLAIWTFIEYLIHRGLFHWRTTTYWTNTLHYLLHGCHHKHPQDRLRLVMPPILFGTLTTIVYLPFYLTIPSFLTLPVCGGAILGYIGYDLTHYFVHFGAPVDVKVFTFLRRYHLAHHFKDFNAGFGITNCFWDCVFGTYPSEAPPKNSVASK